MSVDPPAPDRLTRVGGPFRAMIGSLALFDIHICGPKALHEDFVDPLVAETELGNRNAIVDR